MKKIIVRTFSMLLAIILVLGIFPLTSLAASVSYYQTNKADVPIWSQASKSSTKIRTISTKGTVLRVTSSTKNSSGNLWYKLSDGYWVYSGNVSKHSHSYTGGICTGRSCGYEWPYSVTSFSATVVVTNSSGAKIWSRPYSNKSTHVRTASVNTVLSIVAKTTNQEGNLWLKTSDGYWVYSGNVTRRYTISYNANGGSGAPSSQTYLSGKSLTITSKKPVRTGYIFQGWATSSGSSSVSYKSGSTYSLSGNKTLYAVWKTCSHPAYTGGYCESCNYQYPYSVSSYYGTFVVTNSNGAKIWSRPYSKNSTHVRTASVNTVLSIVAKTVNAEGNLWYKLSDGYWVYSENLGQKFTVSYNANGGSGAPSAQEYVAGRKLTISTKKPVRTGYVFQGWATSSGSSSVSYKAGSTYSLSGNKTLYAVWKECKHPSYSGGYCKTCGYEYKLKITEASGTFVVTNDAGAKLWSRPYSNNSVNLRTAKYKEVLTVKAKAKNEAGNLWYQLSDGSWVYSEHVTQRFSVSYNANGGTNTPANQTFLSGKTIKVSKTKPLREGYIFKGWATSKDSDRVSYEPGETYSKKENLKLYAVWKKCEHKKYVGGYCKECGYEYPVKITKVNYTVAVVNADGAPIWSRPYSDSSKRITTYKKGKVFTVIGKTTNQQGNVWYKLSDGSWVYSKNIKRQFAITYNANGGSGAPATQKFLSGQTAKISKTVPARDGYVFQGWATSSGAKTAKYNPGSAYSAKSDLKLYAVWIKCENHKFNGYGICKSCGYEFVYKEKVTDGVNRVVFTVNNSNGIGMYKRPYQNPKEKVKVLKKGTTVLVVAKAENANDKTWCKLNNGYWVDSDYLKKQPTYNTIDSVPYKYAAVMIGDNADGGLYDSKKITGVTYLRFFDGKQSFYLNSEAFAGTSANTALASVNKALSNALNDRTSVKKDFVYNKRSVKEVKAVSYNCSYDNYSTHKHIVWEISLLSAKAGISGSDGVYVRCMNNSKTLTVEYCTKAKGIERKWAHDSNIYPEFTVETTPYAENGEAVGWFTDFSLLGHGFQKKKFSVEDYVELFSCAVKGVASTGNLVAAPTPGGAFEVLASGWEFYSKVDSYTKSTDYTSGGKNSLTYLDKKTGTAYRTYKITVTSPINLKAPKDYLEAHIYLYELNRNQDIKVKISL